MRSPEAIVNEIPKNVDEFQEKSERLEKEVDECENRIEMLERHIREVNDPDLAARMQRSLAEQQAERQKLQNEADEITTRLQELLAEVDELEQRDTKTQALLREQANAGIDTSEAEELLQQRTKWREDQRNQISALLERLGRIHI